MYEKKNEYKTNQPRINWENFYKQNDSESIYNIFTNNIIIKTKNCAPHKNFLPNDKPRLNVHDETFIFLLFS